MVRDGNEWYHRYRRICELAGLPLYPPLVWPVDAAESARLLMLPDILGPLTDFILENRDLIQSLEPL